MELVSTEVTEDQYAGLAWAAVQYNNGQRASNPEHVDLTPDEYWSRVVTQGALNSYITQMGGAV